LEPELTPKTCEFMARRLDDDLAGLRSEFWLQQLSVVPPERSAHPYVEEVREVGVLNRVVVRRVRDDGLRRVIWQWMRCGVCLLNSPR